MKVFRQGAQMLPLFKIISKQPFMYNRGLAIGVKNLQKGAGKAKARATIFSRSQAVTRLLPLRDNG